jgi:hypothetical protein
MSAVVVKYGVNGAKTLNLDIEDGVKTLKCAGQWMPANYVFEVTFNNEGYYKYDEVASVGDGGKTRRLNIADRGMTTDIVIAAGKYPSSSPLPIEVKTAEEMNTILRLATADSVGAVYKYTGDASDVYDTGELYIITQEDA